MQNRSFVPTSWIKVGLAILPGLFVAGLRSGLPGRMLGWRFQRLLEQSSLLPACIALGIVVAGVIVERRIAAWSLPALGMFLFGAPAYLFTLVARFGDPRSPFWQVAPYLISACLVAMAALAAYRVFKQHGLHIPRSGRALLGLMLLIGMAGAIVGAITDRSPDKWRAFVAHLPLELWLTGLLLLPVAIGLPLARRNGVLAGLILVAFEFVLVDEILDPTYSAGFWAYWEPSAILDRAKTVLSYLPVLSFLVITPIWMLRSRSTRGRALGLLLPTFVALVSTDVIESIALRSALGGYSIGSWLTHSVSTIQLLTALALAAVMYYWLERQGPTEGRPVPSLVHNVA